MAGVTQRSFDQSKFIRGLARAFAGAVLFALPLMMTMEMWWLGFYIERTRFVLLLLVTLVLMVPLSRFVGFESTTTLVDDVLDTFTAWGVGAIASAVLLVLFGLIGPEMSTREIAGKIALQTVPASIGAILARGQMGGGDAGGRGAQDDPNIGYLGNLLIMLAGAVFLAFNVAPTEEMILISYKMEPWQALVLIMLSIVMLLGFVYALDFYGEERLDESIGPTGLLIRQGLAGYGIAVLTSGYMLWTFGRMDGVSLYQVAMMLAVLGFPATLGAAAARLIV